MITLSVADCWFTPNTKLVFVSSQLGTVKEREQRLVASESGTSLSPIRHGFVPGFVNYKKRCTRLASDKVYQLLAHGLWFSPAIRLLPPLKLVAMI
jgi:hypothetical protein